MKKNQTYDLKDIMEAVKSEELDDDFCLYAKENGELNFQDSYLLADYPQIVDNRDVYPRQVREQEMELIYYGEDFADVLLSVMEQKAEATDQECLQALLYYYGHDDFMDFDKDPVLKEDAYKQ